MCCVQIQKCSISKYEKCAAFNDEKIQKTRYFQILNMYFFFKYRKCMSFLQIYKYGKSIYDLKQKNLLISDTKNMLILNTNVTFKYECYLFW